jgi:integrase
MATFSIKVFKHHEKKDGTYNIKVCITHQRKRTYLDTNHYVTAKKLSKEFEIKDSFILKDLYNTLDDYREAISRLGAKVNYMDVEDIKAFLKKRSQNVDFLAFCENHIETLVANGRTKTATGFRTVRYALIDFIGVKGLPAEQITPNFLLSFEKFLRSARQIKRVNQFGKEVITQSEGSTDAGIHNYMHDLRTLFNAAQIHYNQPSLGIVAIPFNPFKEYKLPELRETRKRNLSLEQLQKFISFKPTHKGRVTLAYDLFLLSFYMCGMNAVDLYNSGFKIHNGRLEYQRSKTKGKRKDHAFISIKIPEPALIIIEKYKDKLCIDYSEIGNLNKAVNKGLKIIGAVIGVPDLSFYWARHTFGNLARNTCRKSKDDVALALNHIDYGRRTTDIYLEKDWTIVDEVQEAVMALITERTVTANAITFPGIFQSVNLPVLSRPIVDRDSHMTSSAKKNNEITGYNTDENRRTMRLVKA